MYKRQVIHIYIYIYIYLKAFGHMPPTPDVDIVVVEFGRWRAIV